MYYSIGGEDLATELIEEAENTLESMENFLGTRLTEPLDVFLSEQYVRQDAIVDGKNGYIFLDNSSIYLCYRGSKNELILNFKEKLATILINGMLYGNTLRERLKNNREINVPDWYVSGMAKYVSGNKNTSTAWMADYYEGKLKLNLNLSEPAELAKFGHSVFNYINDSFGVHKLRQLLFYTKLSGKTDYAFQFVLGKSLNWVISDWFKLEKAKYLSEMETRLPGDPEAISGYLKSSEILDMKFSDNDLKIDFLLRSDHSIAVWQFDLSTSVSKQIAKVKTDSKSGIWQFAVLGESVYLSYSDGLQSIVYTVTQGRISHKMTLPFTYILSLQPHPESYLAILAQKHYTVDIHHLVFENKTWQSTELTGNKVEETAFCFDKNHNLVYAIYEDNTYKIKKLGDPKAIYQNPKAFYDLCPYQDQFLSFIQTTSARNIGMIIHPEDSLQNYEVTNYKRSILHYDYSVNTNSVLEGLKYGKLNYLVVSEASTERTKSSEIVKQKIETVTEEKGKDSSVTAFQSYYFITGFEYQNLKPRPRVEPEKRALNQKLPVKIKKYSVNRIEFKSGFIRLAYTNGQFNSPLFAYFFPKVQGIYNGSNLIAGCGLSDISKKYHITANLRQPLVGKGMDFDFQFRINTPHQTFGVFSFNSNYQRELYNEKERYNSREVYLFYKKTGNSNFVLNSRLGYRTDFQWPLSESIENVNRPRVSIHQPFAGQSLVMQIVNRSGLRYSQKLSGRLAVNVYKPLGRNGVMSNAFLSLHHQQSFWRLFHLETKIDAQSSLGKQKTAFLLGGISNWVRPIFDAATVHQTNRVLMYSTTPDFAGLPYNYRAGTSIAMGRVILSMPVNPIVSQQNFNQNFLKYLVLRSFFNAGLAWFGNNPFSIENPDNKEIIETGSMTITNYIAKNPWLWSWGLGMNSVLFGYDVGLEHAIGYKEEGKLGQYTYLTVGKAF